MAGSPMSPEEIKAELDARGLTMSAIGRRLRPKVSCKSVSASVRQLPGQTSARIMRAIAAAVGRSVEDVFGPQGSARYKHYKKAA